LIEGLDDEELQTRYPAFLARRPDFPYNFTKKHDFLLMNMVEGSG
jgi:hypothetical protein